MALDRVDFPTVPNPVTGDWALLTELVEKSYQNLNSPTQWLTGNLIPQGTVFQIGGVVYYGTTDTAITGTPSAYIQITPSGAIASAAYVANLSGVTWNKIYNGYYDVSGNLYIFDESVAILASELSGSNTKFSELFNVHLGQDLKPTDDVIFNSLFLTTSAIETLNSGVSWTVPTDIYSVRAIIIGAGGGGGGGGSGATGVGGTGGTTTFNSIAAVGGVGGKGEVNTSAGSAGKAGIASGNGGLGASSSTNGGGGKIEVRQFSVTPAAAIGYAIGGGGAAGGGLYAGGVGGNGQIILLY